MLLKLIKKLPLINPRIYTYIVLSSLTSVFIINTTAFTQVTDNSQIPQKSIPIAVPTPISNPNPIFSPNLIWPTRGYISQGFRQYRHEGIDIAGAAGTPIVAAAAGNVVKAGWDEWGLGNAIEIRHPNGSVTVYGHNRRLLVSKGQQVKQGQIIAEMGSTGNSTAPHLHFEYYPNGRLAVNPMSFLGTSTANKIPSQPVPSNASKVSPTTQVRQLSPKPENPRSPGAYGGSLLPIPSLLITQPFLQQPVSPSQPIPTTDAQCNGRTRLQGETANALIKICDR